MAATVEVKLDDKTKGGSDSVRKNVASIESSLTSMGAKWAKFGLQTLALQGSVGVVRQAIAGVVGGVENLAARGNPAATKLSIAFRDTRDAFFDMFADPKIQAGLIWLTDKIKKDLIPAVENMKPEKAAENFLGNLFPMGKMIKDKQNQDRDAEQKIKDAEDERLRKIEKEKNIIEGRTREFRLWAKALRDGIKVQEELDIVGQSQDYEQLGRAVKKYGDELRQIYIDKKIDGKDATDEELAREKQRLQVLIQGHYQRMAMIEKERQATLSAEGDKQKAFDKTSGRSGRIDSMNRFSRGIQQPQFGGGFLGNPFAGMFPVQMGGKAESRHKLDMPGGNSQIGKLWKGLNPNEIERTARKVFNEKLNELRREIKENRQLGDKAGVHDAQRRFREAKGAGMRGDIAAAANDLAKQQIGAQEQRGNLDKLTADNLRKASEALATQEKNIAALEAENKAIKAQLDAITGSQRSRAQRAGNR